LNTSVFGLVWFAVPSYLAGFSIFEDYSIWFGLQKFDYFEECYQFLDRRIELFPIGQ
jgi:hypothetical protein